MECKYLGEPTIPQKENHLIYRYRYQKSLREGSKSFYEVDFSAHKDCLIYEIWEEFEKAQEEDLILNNKDLSRYKEPIFQYCYQFLDGGSWKNTSIIPGFGDKQEVLNKRRKEKGVA